MASMMEFSGALSSKLEKPPASPPRQLSPSPPPSDVDSDFYSDEDAPSQKARVKVIYDDGMASSASSTESAAEEHDLEGMALHSVLATPRVDPTPFDPPGYVPIIDKDRILGGYRRIRDALLVERERREETRADIARAGEQIAACKEFGREKMGLSDEVRKQQDVVIGGWKVLIEKMRKKKIEMHKDIAELSTELRNLKQQLEYENALKENESRACDAVEDDIVGKEGLIRRLVNDVGFVNTERVKLGAAESKMLEALESTKEIADDGEERLSVLSEELGLTEVDVFMLQRQVRVAEEESKKWRQRYLMVEKDVRRSEKLLGEFTRSKGVEIQLRSAGGGGGTVATKRRAPRPIRLEEPSLSKLARGFGSIDDTDQWAKTSSHHAQSTTGFLEAVMAERSGTGMESSSVVPHGGSKFAKSRGLTAAALSGNSGEMCEGLKIEFSDSFRDIAGNNNRRGTAKARSIATKPGLWAESMVDT